VDVQGEATLISAIYIKPNSILYGIFIDCLILTKWSRSNPVCNDGKKTIYLSDPWESERINMTSRVRVNI
jgi:hypothetical protein